MSDPIILFSLLAIAGLVLFSSILYFIYRWYTSDRELPPHHVWTNFLDYERGEPLLAYNEI